MRRRNTRKCLQEGLKDLRLPTIRSSCQKVAEQARAESLSHEEFLLALVDQERDVRRQGRIERALRASNLPLEKPLEGFDRKRLPRKVDAHINVLLEAPSSTRAKTCWPSGRRAAARRTCCAPAAWSLSTPSVESSSGAATCSCRSYWLPSATSCCRSSSSSGAVSITHHRRHRLRAAQSPGDGGAFQPAGASL